MINDPQQWLDRFVRVCVSIFAGALVLYGAVWLLSLVWAQLLVIAAILAAATTAIAVWRMRQSRW